MAAQRPLGAGRLAGTRRVGWGKQGLLSGDPAMTSVPGSENQGGASPTPAPHAVERGVVLTAGDNLMGQLGVAGEEKLPWLRRVPVPGTVGSVSCGKYYTLVCSAEATAATHSSSAYAAGGSSRGEGAGGSKTTFRQLSIKALVTRVACGEAHALAGTAQGELFVWGSNANGQLGLGDCIDRKEVTSHPELGVEGVVMMAAGGFHSLVVTANGRLMSFGSNSNGQLGIGRRRRLMDRPATEGFESCSEPQLVEFHEMPDLEATIEVSCISAGLRHSAAVASTWNVPKEQWFGRQRSEGDAVRLVEGELFTWGSNEFGQLGQPQARELNGVPCFVQVHKSLFRHESMEPRQLGCLGDKDPLEVRLLRDKVVDSVACGGGHTVCITRDKCLYAWGRGGEGQLGVKSLQDRSTAVLVAALKGKGVTSVSCGGSHTVAVVDGGSEVYSWGRNEEGQLGLGDLEGRAVPTRVPGVGWEGLGEAYVTADCGARGTVLAFGGLPREGYPPEGLQYLAPGLTRGRIVVCVGEPMPKLVAVLHGERPFSFSVKPPLMEGLTIDPEVGAVTGTPVSGSELPLEFTVTARNKHGSASCRLVLETRVKEKPAKGRRRP